MGFNSGFKGLILIADGTNHNRAQSSCSKVAVWYVNTDCVTDRHISNITTRIIVLNLASAGRVCIPFCLLPTSVRPVQVLSEYGPMQQVQSDLSKGQMCWIPPFSSLVSKEPALSFCRDYSGSRWYETLLTACVITQYHNLQGVSRNVCKYN